MMNGVSAGGPVPPQRPAGLICPQCGQFIETTIFDLLTSRALTCRACGLMLRIDRIKSQRAFDALRKVQAAQLNLEKKSRFNR